MNSNHPEEDVKTEVKNFRRLSFFYSSLFFNDSHVEKGRKGKK
jgi:hypothetical protein